MITAKERKLLIEGFIIGMQHGAIHAAENTIIKDIEAEAERWVDEITTTDWLTVGEYIVEEVNANNAEAEDLDVWAYEICQCEFETGFAARKLFFKEVDAEAYKNSKEQKEAAKRYDGVRISQWRIE
tara:strand:- start:275 stop:655 length:381 start_codon:yes stop_codon:yes gene_type:complete